MTALDRWSRSTFTDNKRSYPTFRQGNGPGVIVIHEMPGLTPKVAAFGQRVVDEGFTVVMPSLFGTPGLPVTNRYLAGSLVKGCVSREFSGLATRRTPPVTSWLRALARSLHLELGGPGVGAVGMCFTGGFALGMMLDEHTVAPVLSQPSAPILPFPKYRADLNLSPADLSAVKARASSGCDVLGLRYLGDAFVGTRFDTLRRELGDRFIAVEFPSSSKADHSVLTEHPQEEGISRVLAFFHEKLR